jgi:hypothetical protein
VSHRRERERERRRKRKVTTIKELIDKWGFSTDE